jgi:hypothetical protein
VGIRRRVAGGIGPYTAAVAAVLGVVSLACSAGDPAESIHFAEPTRYVVQQGDDVGRIARIHRVDVVEVIEWNNLTTDAPDVGSTLLIWPHGVLAPSEDPTVVSTTPSAGGGAPRPRPTGAAPRPGAPPEPEPAPDPGSPVRPVVTVRGAGILGADTTGSEVDLEGATSGLQRRGTGVGGAGLSGDSSFAGGGDAETLAVEERRVVQPTGPQIPNKPVTPPRVAKPAPKRCLTGAVTQVDENGVVREAGLNTSQITAGMASISRYTPQCFPSGTVGSYSMIVEMTVGCDGRVSNVYTVSPGSIPVQVTSCIEQTLASAGFAAHAVPDGMSFQYPMKFRF